MRGRALLFDNGEPTFLPHAVVGDAVVDGDVVGHVVGDAVVDGAVVIDIIDRDC